LEEEVRRLRAEKESLTGVAAHWQSCVQTLFKVEQTSDSSSMPPLHFGPGIFFWVISDNAQELLTESRQLLIQISDPWSQRGQVVKDYYIDHLLP
jgi:hypothetical protein